METTLDQLKPNEKGSVIRINGEGMLRRRLFDMGITPGASIIMKKVAPLGDPIEIHLRGYELSLRKSEASQIIIEK